MRGSVALGLMGLFVMGCAESTGSAAALPDAAPSASATAGSATAGSATAASGATGAPIAPGSTITGTLREQIPVGPYAYVRLETPSGELWAAVNEAPLTVGASVTVYNVMLMERFESQTLQRTFERIYFGSLEPSAGGAGGAPAGTPGMADAAASPGAPPADDARISPITRAVGADARTISELWAQKNHLAGATATVRGVVVKYNPGVMGKNWIHLQDGSGKAKDGTHDLAVTSLETAAIGDTVTVTGTVRTNRDLGAGYVYALLLEEARVARK